MTSTTNPASKKSKIKGKSSLNDLPIELTSKMSLEDSHDEENDHHVDHEEVVIGLATNRGKVNHINCCKNNFNHDHNDI